MSEQRLLRRYAPLVLLIIAAAGLRFGTLGIESIWYDESVTIGNLSGSLSHLVHRLTVIERNPPGYFFVLWLWVKVFGHSIVAMRALSALFGTLTVPVAYAIGRRLVDHYTGLAVAALTTVSPMLLYYSQEMRDYMMMVFLCAASLLAYTYARQDRSGRRLAAWAGVSASALAVHYFSFFVVAPEAVLLLYVSRREADQLRAVVLAVGAVGAVGAALVPLLVEQANTVGNSYPANTSIAWRAVTTIKEFLVGINGPAPALMPILAGLPIAGAGYLLRTACFKARRAALLTAGLGLCAVVTPILIAIAGVDFYDPPNALGAWVPLAVAAGAGLATTRARYVGRITLLASCCLSLVLFGLNETDVHYQRDDWRDVARTLAVVDHPRAIVLVDLQYPEPLEVYRPQARTVTASAGRVMELDLVAIAKREHGGPGPVPNLRPLSKPPAGFRLLAREMGKTYAVLRYLATGPRVVQLRALGATVMGSVITEPAGARPGQL